MKTIWITISALGLAFGASAFGAGSFLSSDQSSNFDENSESGFTPPRAGTGKALRMAIAEKINADSRIAKESIAAEDARKVVLESAYFSRSEGVITGTGRFWDGSPPRIMRVFLDAYDDGSTPLESFPVDIQTTGKSQNLFIEAPDKATFSRFAFRFTINGQTLKLSTPGAICF